MHTKAGAAAPIYQDIIASGTGNYNRRGKKKDGTVALSDSPVQDDFFCLVPYFYAVAVCLSEGAIAFAMRRESGATISIWMGIAIVKL